MARPHSNTGRVCSCRLAPQPMGSCTDTGLLMSHPTEISFRTVLEPLFGKTPTFPPPNGAETGRVYGLRLCLAYDTAGRFPHHDGIVWSVWFTFNSCHSNLVRSRLQSNECPADASDPDAKKTCPTQTLELLRSSLNDSNDPMKGKMKTDMLRRESTQLQLRDY